MKDMMVNRTIIGMLVGIMFLTTLITPTVVFAQSHQRTDLEACLPQSGLSSMSSIGEYRLGNVYCAIATASYENIPSTADYSTASIFEFKTNEDAKTAFWNEFDSSNYKLTTAQGYESTAVGEGTAIYLEDIVYFGVSGKYVVRTEAMAGTSSDQRAKTLLASVNIPQSILNTSLIVIVGIICLIIVATIVIIWNERR
jgi:hypothetical protein